MDDSCTTSKGFETHRLARVVDPDTANFKRQRAGSRASLAPGETLGNCQEARIRHFHGVLDGYLQGRKSRF